MDAIDEQIVLYQELTILIEESVKASQRAERGDNNARCTMKLAQVVMCHKIMEFYFQDEDCAAFMAETEIVLEEQDSLYRDARAANCLLQGISVDVEGIKKAPTIDVSARLFTVPETESNRRHEDFQSSALPIELSGAVS